MKKYLRRILAAALAASAALWAAAPASAAESGWQWDGSGWRYGYPAGNCAQDGWVLLDGNWYCFTPSGYMATGWVQDDGNWYYLDGSGAMKTGWLQDGGNWYYLENDGRMLSDVLLTLEDGIYYIQPNGVMAVGEITRNGRTMVFDSNGRLSDMPSEGTPQLTFVTPSGWFVTESEGSYLLMRQDMINSLDGSNIIAVAVDLRQADAETRAQIEREVLDADNPEVLEKIKSGIPEAMPSGVMDGLTVTGEARQGTMGNSAATYLITGAITQTGVEIPYKISQTHILFDDALVLVQMTSTEPMFDEYEADLEKVISSVMPVSGKVFSESVPV